MYKERAEVPATAAAAALSARERELQATVDRLRAALGTAEPPLIVLTNSELRQKSDLLVPKLRQLLANHSEILRLNDEREKSGEITKERAGEIWAQEVRRAGNEYDQKYRIDTQMTIRALTARIPYDARKHIVGLGVEVRHPSGNPETPPLNLNEVMPSAFAIGSLEFMIRGLGELTKLLPPDGSP